MEFKKLPKAYSYVRMSTPEQKKGHSSTRQTQAAQEYANLNGLELEDILLDEGVSAFRGQNSDIGKLSKFLEAVEDNRVEQGSYLIVESLDRISRQNMLQAFALIDRIIELGIILVTLQDNQKYSRETKAENNANIMFAVVTLLRAHEESKIKSERLSAVWKQKKRDAQKGVKTGQRLPLWLRYNSDKTAIEEIEDRVELVRLIFEHSRDGWGAYSICRKFNETGIQTWNPSTRFWQESYIKKLLSNRAVLGEYQPHRKVEQDGKMRRVPDGEVIRDYYPPIITKDLFAKARRSIEARRVSGKGRKGSALTNLFSGLLECGNCGSGVRFINKGEAPKGGKYLKCSAADLKGECKTRALPYELLEECLLSAIEDLDIEFLLEGERQEKKRSRSENALAELSHEIEQIDERIGKLADAIELSTAELPVLVERMGVAQEERGLKAGQKEAIERELASLAVVDAATQKSRLDALLNELKTKNEAVDREVLRRAISAELRRIVQRIKIRQLTRVPYDFRIDPETWPDAANLSDQELKQLCELYPFELHIRYSSGDTLLFDPLTQEGLRFKEPAKLRLMKRKNDLKRLNGQA